MEHSIKIEIFGGSVEIKGDRSTIDAYLLPMIAKLESASTIKSDTQAGYNSAAVPTGLISLNASTNTIASVLDDDSGSGLVLAAAARLQLVLGKERFSRQEISEEIKEATTFYRTSFTSNLSRYLETLVRARKLNMIAKDTYSIGRTELLNLREALKELEA